MKKVRKLLVNADLLACDCGTTPAMLNVPIDEATRFSGGQVAESADGSEVLERVALHLDGLPQIHVTPFGMCRSDTSPLVIAARAAAQNPAAMVPCLPVTALPWAEEVPWVRQEFVPAKDDDADEDPPPVAFAVLTDDGCLQCAMGGQIRLVGEPQLDFVTIEEEVPDDEEDDGTPAPTQ